MSYMYINHSSDNRPFLSVSMSEDGGSCGMFIHDVTPARLRQLADELEMAQAKAERRARIEAALEAEDLAKGA